MARPWRTGQEALVDFQQDVLLLRRGPRVKGLRWTPGETGTQGSWSKLARAEATQCASVCCDGTQQATLVVWAWIVALGHQSQAWTREATGAFPGHVCVLSASSP